MTIPAIVSSAEISEFFGYTERRLRQLADEDYFPKPVKNQWDFAKVARGLLRFKDEGQSPARERLNEAQLEAQVRKNRIAEKLELREYMATDEVSQILEMGIKALDLIPQKLESEFSLPPAQVKRTVQLLDEARNDWKRMIETK